MEIEGAEVRKLEGYLDWRKRPVDKSRQGGLFAAVFVLVAEVFENLAFLANASNLVTYFHQYMHFPLAKSANTVTNFMGTSFLLPLLGGYLSDAFMPTFVTVIAFAGIEFVGMVLLTIQAHYPSLKPEACDMKELQAGVCEQAHGSKAGMLYMGLYLVALGVGGLKGSLPVHGAEQFDENETKERRLRSNFFNWFLFSMCVGSLLAVTFVVWVQDNKGWQWGFSISTVSVLLILFAFVGGTTVYRNKIPQGSPLTRIAQVFVAAMFKRRIAMSQLHGNDMDDVRERERSAMETADPLLQTSQFRFLDKASIPDPSCSSATGEESPWRLCSVTQVEEVKIMLRVVPIFASTIMMNCCLAQLQTFSVEQATTMDTTIKNFKVPAASLPSIPVICMILLIPIYDQAFVPIARRITGKETGISHLQRVGVGLLLSILSMAVAALVETKRKNIARNHGLLDSAEPLPITFLWVGLQYLFLGLADMFTLAGLMEFFYTEAPSGMRSLATALSWASISMGYYLSSVLVSIVNSITSRIGHGVGWLAGNNLNRNYLDRFYWLLCVLSALNFIHYLMWSIWFRNKNQMIK